jgi:hypothetical protein
VTQQVATSEDLNFGESLPLADSVTGTIKLNCYDYTVVSASVVILHCDINRNFISWFNVSLV